MTKLIHRLRIEVWVRQQIMEMGADDFYTELFATLLKIEQGGKVEPVNPHSRESLEQQRRTANEST